MCESVSIFSRMMWTKNFCNDVVGLSRPLCMMRAATDPAGLCVLIVYRIFAMRHLQSPIPSCRMLCCPIPSISKTFSVFFSIDLAKHLLMYFGLIAWGCTSLYIGGAGLSETKNASAVFWTNINPPSLSVGTGNHLCRCNHAIACLWQAVNVFVPSLIMPLPRFLCMALCTTPITNNKQQATTLTDNNKQRTTNHNEPRTTHNNQQATPHNTQQTPHNEQQQTTNNEQRTTNNKQRTTNNEQQHQTHTSTTTSKQHKTANNKHTNNKQQTTTTND